MATNSTFPATKDTFQTKVDSVDVVQAADVNKLQNICLAIEDATIYNGTGISYTVADPANTALISGQALKKSIENVDGAISLNKKDLTTHKASDGSTGIYEHLARTVSITAAPNLVAPNVQLALVTIEDEIEKIMTGGTVHNLSLDNRYLVVTGGTGAAVVNGNVWVKQSLQVDKNAIFGLSSADTFFVNSNSQFAATVKFDKIISFEDSIQLKEEKRIAFGDLSTTYSFIQHYKELDPREGIELSTSKDFKVILDLDNTDQSTAPSKFMILDSVRGVKFSVDKTGIVDIAGTVTINGLMAGGHGLRTAGRIGVGNVSGSTANIELLDEGLESIKKDFVIKVKVNAVPPLPSALTNASVFQVTQHNYYGGDIDSISTLMTIDENSTVTAGTYNLKQGLTEKGYFGEKVYSNSSSGAYYGGGVNFKSSRRNSPGAISLTTEASSNIDLARLRVFHSNKYGFSYEFATSVTGEASIRGFYTIT